MRTSAAFFLLLALTVSAQDDTEQLLAPFDTSIVAGAGGAKWSSELWVRNDGATAVNLFPATCFSFDRPFPCERRIDVPARKTVKLDLLPIDPHMHPGVFLYVPKSRLADVHVSVRVRDANRPSVGATIPTVRTSEMPRGRATLINVPLAGDTRPSLRVYTPWLPSATIGVRVLSETDDSVIGEHVFPPSGGVAELVTPAYVPMVYDFSVALHEAKAAGADRVRVIVESLSFADQPLWPLATITSNATHEITVIDPR